MHPRLYYTYIMMNRWCTVSYIGTTHDLEHRVFEHKNKIIKGFTSRYNITKLVYYEEYNSAYDAICREKQLKKWSRKKKIALIKTINPNFEDLAKDWQTGCFSAEKDKFFGGKEIPKLKHQPKQSKRVSTKDEV